jgi:hypothetical protein
MIKILNMGPVQRQAYKKQKEKEYNEYLNKPEVKAQKLTDQIKYGQEQLKNIEKAKKYNKMSTLINKLEEKQTEITELLNPQKRKELEDAYNKDIDNLQNYNFYAVTNTQLRDQLDAQYNRMFRNMLEKPKIFGFLPEGTYRKTDPKIIKYVYEHYGQPEANWDDIINDALPSLFNEALKLVPGIGQIYAPIGDLIIEKTQSTGPTITAQDMEVPIVDYERGYDVLKTDYAGLAEQQATNIEERKQLEENRRQLIASGRKSGSFVLHAVVTKDLKPNDALKAAQDIIKRPNIFSRITKNNSIRFRNIPKTKFIKRTFRSKVINPNITLIFGKLA